MKITQHPNTMHFNYGIMNRYSTRRRGTQKRQQQRKCSRCDGGRQYPSEEREKKERGGGEETGADCSVRWTGRWLEGAIPISMVMG